MTAFDTGVILVLSLSVIYSLFRGMIKEVVSLLSVVLGSVVAIKYNWELADALADLIETEAIARVVSFAVLFIATTTVVSLMGSGVRKLLYKSDAISGVDRMFGAVFGLLKGTALLILFVAPLKWFPDYYQKVTEKSVAAPHLEKAADQAKEWLGVPDDFLDRGLRSIKKLPEKMPDSGDLKKFTEQLQKKAEGLTSSKKEPQDQHSPEDQKKLDDLIRSVTKD